jgi:tRNA G18 (ribose-2'-O)-methylase SpoU
VTSPVTVGDASDPRLADYVGLTDVHLRRSLEAAHGLFMAEGEKVIRRAITAGYPVRSLLVTDGRLAGLAGLARLCQDSQAPVYVVPAEVAERLTGYQVHRGALASMRRRPLPAGGRARGHRGPRERRRDLPLRGRARLRRGGARATLR